MVELAGVWTLEQFRFMTVAFDMDEVVVEEEEIVDEDDDDSSDTEDDEKDIKCVENIGYWFVSCHFR